MKRLSLNQVLAELDNISPQYGWVFDPATQQFLVAPFSQLIKHLEGFSLCLNELATDVPINCEDEYRVTHYLLSEQMYNHLLNEKVTCCRCERPAINLTKVSCDDDKTHVNKICTNCNSCSICQGDLSVFVRDARCGMICQACWQGDKCFCRKP